MITYSKTAIVWDKDGYSSISSSILGQIATKKDTMIADGTMYPEEGYRETDTTVTNLYMFTTRPAADEWIAFIDNIATTNSLNKISSRVTDVEKPD